MIGESLAHYKILKKIGSGGMGDVYLAEDTKLGRKVALKVLPPSEERRARFVREAKAASAIDLGHCGTPVPITCDAAIPSPSFYIGPGTRAWCGR